MLQKSVIAFYMTSDVFRARYTKNAFPVDGCLSGQGSKL